MSYKLHEPEAGFASSLAPGGLFPSQGLPLSLEVITSEEPEAKTRSLTVPSADSYQPPLNAGRESWSYNAITANTSFGSTKRCRAEQLGSPATGSARANY